MSEDLIRYDILTQEALRRVIARVLEEVQRAGLPGAHHFFITFDTNHPGVRLSDRMRERYPDEMTIVIQHTFWNLEVGTSAFEIDLSFDDIRERLRIPFDSIRGFFDPSVKFGLQFDMAPTSGEAASEEAPQVPATARKSGAGKASVPATGPAKSKGKRADRETAEGDGDAGADNSAEVVSLDSFRKKK